MESYKREFIQFCIDNHVLVFGSFQLKSGRISPYFFNTGLFSTGQLLKKLGEYYAATLSASDWEYDVLFGPAYKGIPLVVATSIASGDAFAFNRKEKKDHGEGGVIVGELKEKVVLIDDVITAGVATRESVQLLTKLGSKVVGMVVAIDRQEKSDINSSLSAIATLEKELGFAIKSVVTLEEIVEYLEEQGIDTTAIQEYRKQWGC